MTPARNGTVRALAALAVASAALLTGCGAVPDLNPGVAARIGDDTISVGTVTDTAATYCAAVETQLQDGQAIANSAVNRQVAGSLALRAAAEQFAAAEGVTPDAALQQEQEQLEASIAELTDAQQDAVRRVNLASPYAAAVVLAVGKKQGATSDEEATKAGQKAFAAWLADEDVQIDPRFGVAFEDGVVSQSDTSLSYAVSDTAAKADADEPDAAYTAGLPSSQRCG